MFLQAGLGLTRSQWDNNFRAFDPNGNALRRPGDLPWMDFNSADWTFSSAEIPQEIWGAWGIVPDNERENHPGYVPALQCYYWGYRPPDTADAVLFGVRGVFGLGGAPGAFKICRFRQDPKCPGCSPPVACPPEKVCAPPMPCPPPPIPQPCPTCPGAMTIAPTKYGVNIGLLVAGVLTAGVGYYGYRKGWFKRGRH